MARVTSLTRLMTLLAPASRHRPLFKMPRMVMWSPSGRSQREQRSERIAPMVLTSAHRHSHTASSTVLGELRRSRTYGCLEVELRLQGSAPEVKALPSQWLLSFTLPSIAVMMHSLVKPARSWKKSWPSFTEMSPPRKTASLRHLLRPQLQPRQLGRRQQDASEDGLAMEVGGR